MPKYPLLFEPILKERLWGGRALETRFGRRLPEAKMIGESWDLVDRPPDTSTVRNGPLAGRTLHDLCTDFGPRLLGENAPAPDRFPLIVKLLDANDRLSVQIHPTARYVDLHPEAEAAKNEAWYVVEAEPGATIIQGLRPEVKLDDLRAAMSSGEIEPLLRSVTVRPGELYYVPAGLIHALLPGSLMVEIQQNSDTTFRLYDWQRAGLDGKPRALHVAEALEAASTFLADPSLARVDKLAPRTLSAGVELTGGLECPSFRIEKLALQPGEAALALDPASFTILVAVEGAVTVSCPEGAAIRAKVGEGGTTLVPAGLSIAQIASERGAGVLRTTLPRPEPTRPTWNRPSSTTTG